MTHSEQLHHDIHALPASESINQRHAAGSVYDVECAEQAVDKAKRHLAYVVHKERLGWGLKV